jgi:dTDP-4-amino-4,6-dideoxygalactose transaminase
MKIPFCRVACDGNEANYVRDVLAGGWLTTGSRTFEL